MSKEGWVKIYRSLMDCEFYLAEPFTKAQAWLDLILLANHAPGTFHKRGIKVEITRGQVGHDLDTLAERWKWSRGKVERFFIYLENSQMIVRQKTNVTTLLSVLNYEKHQGGDKANSKANSKTESKANDKPEAEKTVTQTVTQTDTNKNDKEFKEGINTEEVKIEAEKIILSHPLQIYASKLILVPKLKAQLTLDQCQKLIAGHGEESVKEILDAMDNKKNLCSLYVSVYSTAISWLKLRNNKNPKNESKLSNAEEAKKLLSDNH